MRSKRIAALFMAAALCVCCAACSENASQSTDDSADAVVQTLAAALSDEEMFTDRDYEVGYSDYVTITLSDGASSADGSGVAVDGDTITISTEGTYLLTGTLSDGQIIINASDAAKVQLVLDGASINCSNSAAIYIKQADKVFLTIAENSENTLSVSGEYVETDDNNVDGVIFSKSDLTMNGNGTLAINAEYGHGVVSKDDLKVTSGSYVITAASSGLSGKDSVRIAGGAFNITSEKDGIHSENTDDSSKGFIYIADGTFDITSGSDGIEASGTLTIKDGDFIITAGGGAATAATHTDSAEDMWGQGGTLPDGSAGGRFGGNGGTRPDMPTNGTGEAPTDMPTNGTMEAPSDFPTDGSAVSPSDLPDDAVSGATADAAQTDAMSVNLAADGASGYTAIVDTTTIDAADTSATVSGKGIKSGTGTIVTGGSFVIDASDDAVHTNGDMTIAGGAFTISTGDDGMHADGALDITAGTITVSESYEGLEGATITISGGDIAVTASDDGLNASGGNDSSGTNGFFGQDSFDSDSSAWIVISGGTVTVNAAGDGIDSNGDLTVSGGTVYVNGPTDSANGALDYGGAGMITGGTVIAVGGSGMAQNFGSDSSQGSILYNLSSSQSAGTEISLVDSAGNVLASFTAEKSFQSVVISAPGIESDGTYTLNVGTEIYSIEMTAIIYGNSGTMGGFMSGGRGDKSFSTDTSGT